MQNFLVFPCYLVLFISLIPASCYFAIFIFYYIITERSHLRTLSFYFKIYYLKNIFKKPNTPKTEQTPPLVFLVHDKKPNKSLYLKKLIYSPTPTIFLKNSATLFNYLPPKKIPSHEVFFINFVFNSRITIYSTLGSRLSHPHKLARDYSLSNNAASARYPPPIPLANDQSDTYNTPYAPRDKHLTA